MRIKKKCFVIMPFSATETCADWTNVFENLIKPAVKGMGLSYNCERSTIDGGPFIKGILESLYRADLVIADITDRNANVFYELGVRHTLRNRTIIITQDSSHLPSDLAGYGVVVYKSTIDGLPKLKRELKRIVKKIHQDPDRSDNPVSDYIKKRNYLILDYERDHKLRRLSSLHAELYDNATTIIKNKTNYNDIKYPLFGSFTKSAEDMLTSQYVDVSIDMHAYLKECILHLQKVDYYAKLLSGQPLKLREIHKDIYFHHMDASLGYIFQVKNEVQELIKEISNNGYRLEKKPPIMRSMAWESSQAEIEEWIKSENLNQEKTNAKNSDK